MGKDKQRIEKCERRNMLGITLVALVVTIVVLLILAGVTLLYVLGDNGVFNQALEAKEQTEIAKYREMLETAKSPIIIERLGTFDPEAYFTYIEKQGIIESKDKSVINNEDGTYDVTTKPGYVFLVTVVPNKEKPKDAEIEYLGQTGKLQPKIRKIIVTSKDKTNINVKIVARLEQCNVECYYKLASAVEENEVESSINGYTSITLNENLEGNISGLTPGESYKIKAVLQKEGKIIGWISIQEDTVPLATVTSITLDKETAKIAEEEILQLNAIVKPDDAEEKTVTWTSSDESIVTVSQTGLITGVEAGTATITVTTNNQNKISASCIVTVTNIWEKINRIAKAIANDEKIDNTSSQATGITEENEEYDIEIGDMFYVKYKGEKKQVRVLGFKHDDLVNTEEYGGNHKKASISFEFYDLMIPNKVSMNSSNTNIQGWGGTALRTYLNGTKDSIGGHGEDLNNKQYIKKVIKPYLLGNKSTTIEESQDWLWLLSCAEIWNTSAGSPAVVGYASGREGEQYAFYKKIVGNFPAGTYKSDIRKTAKQPKSWWLRSPGCNNNTGFCYVYSEGRCSSTKAYNTTNDPNVAPGFSI